MYHIKYKIHTCRFLLSLDQGNGWICISPLIAWQRGVSNDKTPMSSTCLANEVMGKYILASCHVVNGNRDCTADEYTYYSHIMWANKELEHACSP